MNVYLNKISGIDDAIVSMYMSKRTWTRLLECEIRATCNELLSSKGEYLSKGEKFYPPGAIKRFQDYMDKLTKWGQEHITMLRFIEFSITVEGLHRAGQDDWDAHAMRYNNRIIRTSTRMSKFGNELSDYYKGKILPTDMALEKLGIVIPDEFEEDGETWVKTTNGYVKKRYMADKDALRGLYMLSIPSNFVFKVNLTEWAHVYKERNTAGHAHPEVKECCEAIADALESAVPWFDRDLFTNIKN